MVLDGPALAGHLWMDASLPTPGCLVAQSSGLCTMVPFQTCLPEGPGAGRGPGCRLGLSTVRESQGRPLDHQCASQPPGWGPDLQTLQSSPSNIPWLVPHQLLKGFPGDSDSKEPACNAGDWGLIPGLGRYS